MLTLRANIHGSKLPALGAIGTISGLFKRTPSASLHRRELPALR